MPARADVFSGFYRGEDPSEEVWSSQKPNKGFEKLSLYMSPIMTGVINTSLKNAEAPECLKFLISSHTSKTQEIDEVKLGPHFLS